MSDNKPESRASRDRAAVARWLKANPGWCKEDATDAFRLSLGLPPITAHRRRRERRAG